MAYWDSLNRLKHDVRAWNTWRQQHPEVGIDLRGAPLSRAPLAEADLSNANLTGAILNDADLRKAILSDADLRKADLRRAHLRKADLSEAILCGIDFRLANLIETNFNGALLTDARLWASQRAGWSIQGVRCQAAYWDRDGRERTLYRPGEFERLYAETTHLVLHYAEGLSPLALATLPALIQRMEAAHLGSVLRLRSVHAEAGGATVTVVIDELGGHTLDDLQDQAKQLQAAQRSALAQADLRQGIEHQWSQLKDAVFPVLLEQA
jgi:Pentapeptide repeats (8 copies)